MKSTRAIFRVTLDIPNESNIPEMQRYIKTAIVCWKNGGNPEDPVFKLNDESVRVSILQRITTYI